MNGRSFFDSASCENYALAGGLLSQRPGAKELKGQQFCANENQLCQFPGTAAVTYGAGDKWTTKTLPGPVTCRASTFSVDPTPLTMNSCYVLDTALQANNGLAFCANENQVCQFAGQLEVSYGVEDKWKKLTLNGPVSCTDSTFGDPSPGKAKNCYVKFDPADTVHRRRFCAKLYRLGFRAPHIARNTMSNANAVRDWRIYADFAQHLDLYGAGTLCWRHIA